MSSVLKSAVSVAPGSAPVLQGGVTAVFQLPEASPPESWFQVSVPAWDFAVSSRAVTVRVAAMILFMFTDSSISGF